MQWLKTLEGFGLDHYRPILPSACEGGHMEIIRWLRSEGCPWNQRACYYPARGGHLEVLKWLRTLDPPCPWDGVCSSAAGEGQLHVLKYLFENGCPWDDEICSSAAETGHLDVLKYAHENGYPLDETCASAAYEYGPWPHIMEYLRENDCPGM